MQLLRIAAVSASLKVIFVFDFDVSQNHGQHPFMNIDSRNPIRHRLPPGGNGERAGLTLIWVSGYRRPHRGETTRHLFARSRTLRIKLTFGLKGSNVIPISPLPAVPHYYSEPSDFHRISRAEGPTQLTWMAVIHSALRISTRMSRMRMMSRMRILVVLLSVGIAFRPADAQWQVQDSNPTANLTGIDSVDGTVARASGAGGTVLKTTDGGAHWQKCAIPDGVKDGTTLDFRGVQAWDAATAIVMSSGKGNLSRLYKTTDSCKTWKLILKNTDRDGFWDALYFERPADGKGRWINGWLLGNPVDGMFSLFYTYDSGKHWFRQSNKGLRVKPSMPLMAKSTNTSSGKKIWTRISTPIHRPSGIYQPRIHTIVERGGGKPRHCRPETATEI